MHLEKFVFLFVIALLLFQVFGYSFDPGQSPCLAYQFMPNGSVEDRLMLRVSTAGLIMFLNMCMAPKFKYNEIIKCRFMQMLSFFNECMCCNFLLMNQWIVTLYCRA